MENSKIVVLLEVFDNINLYTYFNPFHLKIKVKSISSEKIEVEDQSGVVEVIVENEKILSELISDKFFYVKNSKMVVKQNRMYLYFDKNTYIKEMEDSFNTEDNHTYFSDIQLVNYNKTVLIN